MVNLDSIGSAIAPSLMGIAGKKNISTLSGWNGSDVLDLDFLAHVLEIGTHCNSIQATREDSSTMEKKTAKGRAHNLSSYPIASSFEIHNL